MPQILNLWKTWYFKAWGKCEKENANEFHPAIFLILRDSSPLYRDVQKLKKLVFFFPPHFLGFS